MPADGYERVLCQLAQLLLGQRLSIGQRTAIDILLLDCRPHIRQHAEVGMDRRLDRPVGALLARAVGAFVTAEHRQLDPLLRADQLGQAEPPAVDLAGDHAGGDIDRERRAELFHDWERMGQVVGIAVIEGKGRERARVARAQTPDRLVQADELNALRLQPAQGPGELAHRAAQRVVGMNGAILDHAVQREDHAATAIARGDHAAQPRRMGSDRDTGLDECWHAHWLLPRAAVQAPCVASDRSRIFESVVTGVMASASILR
jgi:hypothetical protein